MTKEEKMRGSSLNVTDVEQSKKLDKLGLDPCSADFHWEKMEEEDVVDSDMPVIRNGYHLVPGANPAFFINGFSYRNGYIIPAWSVGRLLDLMPTPIHYPGCEEKEDIVYEDYMPNLGMDENGSYFCEYLDYDGEGLEAKSSENKIDAEIQMIEWLFKNKYIKPYVWKKSE